MRGALLAAVLLITNVGAAAAQGMPGVDVKDLEADEIIALGVLMSEGACPCNPKISLVECIQQKACPAATELASFGAARFRDGDGVDEVREAVVRKYMADHVTFTFDLSTTPKKGAPDGRIKIVEFADFECPHCALMRPLLDEVAKAYPKDVTLYFKQFPLPHHIYAEAASRATLAAHRQGRFWPMHDLIFTHQTQLEEGSFVAFATELGLNVEKFKTDMADPAIAQQVQRDRQEGEDARMTGTPTVYVNGKLYAEDKSVDAMKAYIRQQLDKLAAQK